MTLCNVRWLEPGMAGPEERPGEGGGSQAIALMEHSQKYIDFFLLQNVSSNHFWGYITYLTTLFLDYTKITCIIWEGAAWRVREDVPGVCEAAVPMLCLPLFFVRPGHCCPSGSGAAVSSSRDSLRCLRSRGMEVPPGLLSSLFPAVHPSMFIRLSFLLHRNFLN